MCRGESRPDEDEMMRRSNHRTSHVAIAVATALATGTLGGCAWPETDISSTTTTTGTDSTLTEYPFNCWGDPSPDNTIDDCVVFARADAEGEGNGTKAEPYSSLQTAIDQASKLNKRVFACGDAAFEGAFFVDAPIELWGGFDCSDWHYSSVARTKIEGPADQPAITLSMSSAGALLVSLATFTPSSEKPGGSAIGMLVDAVEKQTFVWRCDITAGEGRDGLDGDPPTGPAKAGADAAFAGQDGAPSDACAAAPEVAGGEPGATDCDDGKSTGGQGGPGATAPNGDGQDGSNGMPMPPDNPTLAGLGGDGQSAAKACFDGATGATGMFGGSGHGAETKGHASVHGIDAVGGEAGTRGARGQGGGGGGGARAGLFCMSGNTPVEGPGASGGGGGAGGCGGKGGAGGMAGGDSIGILTLGGKLVVNYTTINIGRAGHGGAGAAGQPGGPGGKGASGGASSGMAASMPGCSGGDGGQGGPGGPGGGGRGGHSVGIAYYSTKPVMNYVHAVPGDKGEGGLGGPGNELQGEGIDGVTAEYAEFTSL